MISIQCEILLDDAAKMSLFTEQTTELVACSPQNRPKQPLDDSTTLDDAPQKGVTVAQNRAMDAVLDDA
jgi:hypothetical protein